MNAESLRTVSQLATELPAFDERALRRLIFNAGELGLSPAIVRIGRRVFIDKEAFDAWLERCGRTPAP
jgi:hypothetical protein